MTVRTEYEQVRIVGGPQDGLLMQVRLRPNGVNELDCGALFFPDGIEGYYWDREAGTLTLRTAGAA